MTACVVWANRKQQFSKEGNMKELIGIAIAVLALSSSTFATGGVWITISGNGGQKNTQAEEFRYNQSPRDLAGGSSSAPTAATATSARGVGGGRAAMRRVSDPVVIVKALDGTYKFLVNAAANG